MKFISIVKLSFIIQNFSRSNKNIKILEFTKLAQNVKLNWKLSLLNIQGIELFLDC